MTAGGGYGPARRRKALWQPKRTLATLCADVGVIAALSAVRADLEIVVAWRGWCWRLAPRDR
jgi:hypothetical protein